MTGLLFVLDFPGSPEATSDDLKPIGADPGRVIRVCKGLSAGDATSTYRHVTTVVDSALRGEGAEGVLSAGHRFLLTDPLEDPDDLNPDLEGPGHRLTVVGMLILTYPEFDWTFPLAPASAGPFAPKAAAGGSASRVWAFDPTGRRDFVRARFAATHQPIRRHACAAAIDDDEHFALLHAYVAYRCGYRTEAVMSWAAMRRLFEGKGTGTPLRPFELLLEDMSLKFPDRDATISLQSLEARAELLPGLAYPRPARNHVGVRPMRWLVTSGQTSKDALKLCEDNIRFIQKGEDAQGGKGGLILKPVTGIYGLIESAGLRPAEFHATASAIDDEGHGAPGKIALVARTLLGRARALRASSPNVEGALLAATCALDALELTAGESPMVGIEALGLRHECEVLAECKFAGVSHRIEVNDRFDDIGRSMDGLQRNFATENRMAARLNAEAAIVTALMRVFREHARFDEEMQCLNRIRSLNLAMARQRPLSMTDPMSLIAPLGWPAHWYLKTLIRSPAAFVGVLVLWMSLVGLAFLVNRGLPSVPDQRCAVLGVAMAASTATLAVCEAPSARPAALSDNDRLMCAGFDTVTTFFGMGSPVHPSECEPDKAMQPAYSAIVTFSMVLGAIHLGIFISFLYTLLSRR